MYQRELEKILGFKLSEEDYKAAEVVYLYHPACEYKNDIATYWVKGGRALIDEMMPRALKIRAAEQQQSWLRGELEGVTRQLEVLKGRGKEVAHE